MGLRAPALSPLGILPRDPWPTVRRLYPASAMPRWTDIKGALLPWNPALEIALSNTIASHQTAPQRTAFRRAQIPVGAWRNIT